MKKYRGYPEDTTLSDRMRDFKAYTSKRIQEQLEQQRCVGFIRITRLWQIFRSA